jgi:hypothetical protein
VDFFMRSLKEWIGDTIAKGTLCDVLWMPDGSTGLSHQTAWIIWASGRFCAKFPPALAGRGYQKKGACGEF